jgi:molybdenum cofactor cytidylyltransferase
MITGILLAAGSGSRFGGGKLIHALPDGTPIGVASLRNLRRAVGQTLAVVRDGDDALRKLLEAEGTAVRICPDAERGMARSLVCGVEASRDADGWVIALGDMPFVLPQTINAIVERVTQSGHIAIPAYRGQRGHPVAFGRRYRDEILKLDGDEGARSILGRHPGDVEIVECNDRGILRDIDTKADLEQPAG